MVAHFDFTVAVTFSVDPEAIRGRLMPGLELDLYDGRAFVAVALVQTRALRPGGFPKFLGQDFLLAGYRIFVRHRGSDGRTRRGLQVLRSDTDSGFMCVSGNLMTHYNYSRIRGTVERDGSVMRVVTEGEDRLSCLDVRVDLADPSLPDGSVFRDLRSARRFAGPMPFTFSYEHETGKLISVEGRRKNWRPGLVRADVLASGFLDSFPAEHRPEPAAAFVVESVDYRWERGVVWDLDSASGDRAVAKRDKGRGRSAVAGTANIVRFNWPAFLMAGAVGLGGAALASSRKLPWWLRMLGGGVGAGAIGQAAVSLGASHWVYDRSQFRNAGWIADRVSGCAKVLNVHSGFDEVTADLRRRLPRCEVVAADLFDPVRMPEASIRRARAAYPPPAGTVPATPERLPFRDGEFDAVLLIFAAHEWRDGSERGALFGEIARVMVDGGVLLIAEHVRDGANFAAFGPGYLHFLPEDVWRNEPVEFFDPVRDERAHPLVHVFEFKRRTA